MKTLKILDWPEQRFYSETHPFYRWKNKFMENGIRIQFYHDHLDKDLKDADYLIIHSRYFDSGKNLVNETRNDKDQIISYLLEMKKTAGKLIWYDAADSSGSSDFSFISYTDIFLKKQVLKQLEYYTAPNSDNDLRIWLNSQIPKKPDYPFVPCPVDQLKKIKLGWNIGLNDYRYFGYKLSRLSNFLSYGLYPVKLSKVEKERPLDLTFRGTIHKGKNGSSKISEQRNNILKLLGESNMNIASGSAIPKLKYWKELRNSKLSISPFGWGEICYRDFESFISGALLIKPSMQHLETYPDVFKPYETYVPVNWDLKDLPEKLDHLTANYSEFKQIASNGQEVYYNAMNDSDSFVNTIIKAIA